MPATGDTQYPASPTSATRPFDQAGILIWFILSK